MKSAKKKKPQRRTHERASTVEPTALNTITCSRRHHQKKQIPVLLGRLRHRATSSQTHRKQPQNPASTVTRKKTSILQKPSELTNVHAYTVKPSNSSIPQARRRHRTRAVRQGARRTMSKFPGVSRARGRLWQPLLPLPLPLPLPLALLQSEEWQGGNEPLRHHGPRH